MKLLRPRICPRCNVSYKEGGYKYCATCGPIIREEQWKASAKLYKSPIEKRREYEARPDRKEAHRIRQAARYHKQREERVKRGELDAEPRVFNRKEEGDLLECTKCKVMRPRGQFHRNGKKRDGTERRSHWCKMCSKERMSEAQSIRRMRGGRKQKFPKSFFIWKFKEQQGKCALCGGSLPPPPWIVFSKNPTHAPFHVDHIIPLSKGGDHSPLNVQLTHPLCNMRKGSKVLGSLV